MTLCQKHPKCGCPSKDECVDPRPHPMVAKTFYFSESNGNEWWSVFLLHNEEDSPLSGHQVYRDEIQGRAEYECAVLNAFITGAEPPSILDFDTDPPPKLAAKWKAAQEPVLYQVKASGKGATWGPGCSKQVACAIYRNGKSGFSVRALKVVQNFDPAQLEE